MINVRFLEDKDDTILQDSLGKDEYHKSTTVDFFKQPGTLSTVYSDEKGIGLFCRATKCLRLDLQFVSNTDYRRNVKIMYEGFSTLTKQAKENGFTEIVFFTNHELLRKFCKKRLGFEDIDGYELRKFI